MKRHHKKWSTADIILSAVGLVASGLTIYYVLYNLSQDTTSTPEQPVDLSQRQEGY